MSPEVHEISSVRLSFTSSLPAEPSRAAFDPVTDTAFPVMHAHELLAEIPEMKKCAEPQLTEFALVRSFGMTPWIAARLAREIRNLLVSSADDGVVVTTHGTDIMEETTFALDLLLDCEQPVAITGATRNASQPGIDGASNLVSTVCVAGSRITRTLRVAGEEVAFSQFP